MLLMMIGSSLTYTIFHQTGCIDIFFTNHIVLQLIDSWHVL